MPSVPFSARAQSKVASCIQGFQVLGIQSDEVLDRYGASEFTDSSFLKKEVIDNLFSGSLPTEIAEYLSEKCNLPFHRDMRQSVDYGIDLILGWVIEDAMIIKLTQLGLDAQLQGHDRDREFLRPHQISQDPDILVKSKSGNQLIEIMCDWKDTWLKQDHLDLRNNKYLKLQSTGTFLFGIAPLSQNGLLIHISTDNTPFKHNPSIRGYGGKEGFTLEGVKDRMQPIDNALNNLVTAINEQ